MPTHLTAGEAGQLAAQAECKRVLLTHFYPECFAVDVAAQCRKLFSGEIELASDLQRLIL
jgi:ribonuclease BN (tRNA processing enzyme)